MLSFYDGHGLWKQFAKELSAVLINELNQLADFPIKFSSVHSLEAIHRSLISKIVIISAHIMTCIWEL